MVQFASNFRSLLMPPPRRLRSRRLHKKPQKMNYVNEMIDLFNISQIFVLTTEQSICGGLPLDTTHRGHTFGSEHRSYVTNYWS